VLDVWENEPAIDAALHDLVTLATPHIACYSLDGKLRGSLQIHQALAAHLGQTSGLTLDAICPSPALASVTLQQALPSEDALRRCAAAVYDVRRDHESLTRETYALGLAKGFDRCRANYPLRREFSTLTVRLRDEAQPLAPVLSAAGFNVVLA
jgi:erythronate-4-phosphate dehydrogenase